MRMFCKSIDSVVFDLSVSPQTKQKLIEVLQEIAETNPNDEYIAIEKGFQSGGRIIRNLGYHLESLAIVDSMDASSGTVVFHEQ